VSATDAEPAKKRTDAGAMQFPAPARGGHRAPRRPFELYQRRPPPGGRVGRPGARTRAREARADRRDHEPQEQARSSDLVGREDEARLLASSFVRSRGTGGRS
jgi:hypothetical protein